MFSYAATIISVLLRVNVLFVLFPLSACAFSSLYEKRAVLKKLTSFFTSSRNQCLKLLSSVQSFQRWGCQLERALSSPPKHLLKIYLFTKQWKVLFEITSVATSNDLFSLQNYIVGTFTPLRIVLVEG